MCPVRISAATPIILTQIFLGSPQFFQAHIITVLQIGADLSGRAVEGTKCLLHLTLESLVRIPFESWQSPWVFSLFLLPCVSAVQGLLPNVYEIRNYRINSEWQQTREPTTSRSEATSASLCILSSSVFANLPIFRGYVIKTTTLSDKPWIKYI
jgi:hypothetical protein